MMGSDICTAWLKACVAVGEVHGCPIKERGILEIGDKETGWGVQLNTNTVRTENLDALDAMVWWKGFPVGCIGMNGGAMIAGEPNAEADFIKWLEETFSTSAAVSGGRADG